MKNILSVTILASLISLPVFAGSHSGDVRLGIALGFTGPAESLAASMAAGAELAIDEVSKVVCCSLVQKSLQRAPTPPVWMQQRLPRRLSD